MTRKASSLALLVFLLASCGSQSGTQRQETGGAGRTGGATASGGAGSGGAMGAAGAAGSGGRASSGGASGANGGSPGAVAGSGAPGPGGSSVIAGSSGGGARTSGGTTGAAGATGPGGGASGSGQTCTGRPAPAAGDARSTLQHDGRARTYLLHVPSGLTAGVALALVFDLHGAGGSGSQQKGMSGFSALADKKKFLAVFPDGVDGYWNVDDTCCGTAGKQKVDDVGFLRAIITKLKAETCLDANRIYVSGFSNGGGLTHRMGCQAADVIAAIAPMSTDLRTQPCEAARPIAMLEVRGLADSLEPYAGGLVGPAGGQYTAVGAKASLQLWADINRCTGATTAFETYCERYTQCANGVETALCSLPNVDHSPYGNSLGLDVASVAWSMFERQPMK